MYKTKHSALKLVCLFFILKITFKRVQFSKRFQSISKTMLDFQIDKDYTFLVSGTLSDPFD